VAIVADLVRGHYVQRPPSAFDKALFPRFPPAQLWAVWRDVAVSLRAAAPRLATQSRHSSALILCVTRFAPEAYVERHRFPPAPLLSHCERPARRIWLQRNPPSLKRDIVVIVRFKPRHVSHSFHPIGWEF
jgi:hypothetical protein